MTMEIIPSILVKTRQEFEEKVRTLESRFTRAHLDIADGIFVPNTKKFPFISPGVASSFNKNLTMCAAGLRNFSTISFMLLITVLFP